MQVLKTMKWFDKPVPDAEKRKAKNLVKVTRVRLMNHDFDYSKYCDNDTVLITGDGHTLPGDVKRFDALNIPHDLFCVNRSMLFFQREVRHWAAVDVQECVWFSENYQGYFGTRICRHTIGQMPIAFDAYWIAENNLEGYAKMLWTGNSSMLAILASFEMGYKKIILAGIPLDNGPHWYEPADTPGPEWIGRVYQQWMDVKILRPEAERVRSLSGYSAFIFGEPTKEWLNGNSS